MTSLATRQRPTPGAPTDGSRTITLRDDQPREEGGQGASSSSSSQEEGEDRYTVGVLRLRGGPSTRGRVQWAEDTVDNEEMGKKKSKICCIYHKPKRYDESSDESSDSSDSDSDSDSESAHHCDHPHPHAHNHHNRSRGQRSSPRDGQSEGSARQRGEADAARTVDDLSDPDTNAYEMQPSGKKRKIEKGKGPAES